MIWPFRRAKTPPAAALLELQRGLRELADRTGELEQLQLKRELEWQETRDQVMRHLKRMNAVKQHLDGRDAKEQEQEPAGRPSPSAVLAAKFRR